MKKMCSLLILLGLLVCPVMAIEILAPGDAIIAVDSDESISLSDYPGGEAPANILDGDVGTKYLNFGGWRYNTGFIVTPGSSSIVQSFQISTANDAAERDPVSYELWGTNDAISSANNSTGLAENWTLIDSGSLSLPAERLTAGSIVNVNNSSAYTSYKMTFPKVNTSRGDGLMQISEVDLFSGLDGTGGDLLTSSDAILGIQNTPDSHYPAAENPGNLLDGDVNTKYLNFGNVNSGFIVTPSVSAVVRGFQIATANDAPERDPASWVLYGSKASEDNSQGLGENWVMIDEGTLALSDERFVYSGIIGVDNDTIYDSYKMLFTALKDAEAANSMQISEIQFYDIPDPATIALLGLGGLLLRRRK